MRTNICTAFMTVALLLGVSITSLADNDKVIDVSQLPAAAQTLVSTYFGERTVAVVKQETEVVGKSYEVIFSDGDKVEFDKKGNWTEVKCKKTNVPNDLVPTEILSYVNTHYPEAKVVTIEIDRKNYEVDLDNGLEIKFDKKFNVVDIDS